MPQSAYKGKTFSNLKYRNNTRILRIYHNSNYLFTSVQLFCFKSNSNSELTAYILECGVTYGIKVFDKEVALFKSFYAKLMVLESFSLDSNCVSAKSLHKHITRLNFVWQVMLTHEGSQKLK